MFLAIGMLRSSPLYEQDMEVKLSQVVVTNDTLKRKRERSREQEHQIDRESGFSRWRRNDITGKDPFASMVGFAVTPILALWGLLCGAIAVTVTVLRYLFRLLGQVVGGRKSLITGKPNDLSPS